MKRKSLEGWISRILPSDLDFELTQEDVDAGLLDHRPVPLLFGRLTSQAILEDLKERGLEKRLSQRGYGDLQAEISQVAVGQEGLQISAAHPGAQDRQRIMELKAFWGTLELPEGAYPKSCRALVWDWLELRDPMADFRPGRPPLPGQTAPGLSMFHDLVDLMREYVSRTDAEALVTIPQYFHNAVLYQKDSGLRYRFIEPLRQGQLMAQMRDLLAQGDLHAATWAFEENRVEMLSAEPETGWTGYPWTPSELVLPLTRAVEASLQRDDPGKQHGLACRFRIRDTPHPDIEGSFHLSS